MRGRCESEDVRRCEGEGVRVRVCRGECESVTIT